MKKRDLLIQNTDLYNKVKKSDNTITELKKDIFARDEKIKKLEQEIEILNSKINATKPLKELEAKVVRQAAMSKDVEYGASVIGKTVVEAAKCCNELTNESAGDIAKELVNLILGRTEVAKAEILRIVSSNIEMDEKTQQIDAQFDQAIDYFNSVMAQGN